MKSEYSDGAKRIMLVKSLFIRAIDIKLKISFKWPIGNVVRLTREIEGYISAFKRA
jgi:hypothetical protein